MSYSTVVIITGWKKVTSRSRGSPLLQNGEVPVKRLVKVTNHSDGIGLRIFLAFYPICRGAIL
jgi:hypothetical protein